MACATNSGPLSDRTIKLDHSNGADQVPSGAVLNRFASLGDDEQDADRVVFTLDLQIRLIADEIAFSRDPDQLVAE